MPDPPTGVGLGVSTRHGLWKDLKLRWQITDEQVSLLFRKSPALDLIGVAYCAALCVLMAADEVALVMVLSWLALKTLSTGARLTLNRMFLRARDPAPRTWLRPFLILLSLDGAVWGLACVLIAPALGAEMSGLLLVSMLGVAAIGSLTLAMHWRANVLFTAPIIVPAAAWQIMLGHPAGVASGLGLLLLCVILWTQSRRIQGTIIEMLRLQLVNARIAEERRAALEQAERSNRVKSQFLATISHEMRTPLHGIIGMTQQLAQEPRAQPVRQELDIVERSGTHLLELINSALDLSRMEMDQLRLQRVPFDLSEVLAAALSLAAPLAREKGLTLDQGRRLSTPCWVEGDSVRLQQVIHNLLGNAMKFTEEGGVRLDAWRADNGQMCIEVTDSGIGIAAADLEMIFDAFRQGDASFSRRYNGAGLGLAICRQLARRMEGEVTVRSQLERGSTFCLTLTLPPCSAPEPDAARHQPDGAVAPAPGGPRRLQGHVLLAEDNPVNAIVTRAALEQLGLTVDVVADGEAAVQACQAALFDLVLMDCQMPRMDGLQATRLLRQWEQAQGPCHVSLPIIALTANALDEDRSRCLACGMNEHVAKPFRVETLRRLLERYLPAQPKPRDTPQTATAEAFAKAPPNTSSERAPQDKQGRLGQAVDDARDEHA